MLKQETIRNLLGNDRLYFYLSASQGELSPALELYLWNSRLASSYWGLIESFEILLRRRISGSLFNDGVITQVSLNEITTGSYVLDKPMQPYSKMTFGFWTYLLSAQNANKVWNPTLHKAFRNGSSRKALHLCTSEIQKLRNRIGHHEAIWHLNHEDLNRKIFEVLEAISDEAVAWVESTTNLQTVLAERPAWLPKNASGQRETQSRGRDSSDANDSGSRPTAAQAVKP